MGLGVFMCNYCYTKYPSQTAFTAHFRQCPVRIKYGYIENPNPTAKERWKKIKEGIA